MRTRIMTVCCMLAISTSAVAANRTITLRPNDTEALKAARIAVTHRIVNASDHAFEITADVPEGFKSLDAKLWVRNDKGLVTYSHWDSSAGKCVAVLMVGERALNDAVFTVVHHKGDRFAPFADRVGHVLKLSEFGGVALVALSCDRGREGRLVSASPPSEPDGPSRWCRCSATLHTRHD